LFALVEKGREFSAQAAVLFVSGNIPPVEKFFPLVGANLPPGVTQICRTRLWCEQVCVEPHYVRRSKHKAKATKSYFNAG